MRKCSVYFLWILLVLFFVTRGSLAATYYIRSDGGSSQQCSGTTDTPYAGSGTGQPCAWSHPFWALDSNGNWIISDGDTIIINPGIYMMGYGAPNTGSAWCEPDGAFECHLPALPSGTPISPTRILGKGWDTGCKDPPELWGTQRADTVLSLGGTSNVVIDCLEITDHSGCVDSHSNQTVACERDHYPYGDWAAGGISASDSSHVTLRNLNIHGFAEYGIRAGRLTDWTIEDVRIAANGLVGWDGDIDGQDSNSGTLSFKGWTVEWNGCAESYPDKQPNNCWAQTAGGYGDGVGTGQTGGNWFIEDSIFRHNTSDGLDLLYLREPNSQLVIKRIKSYGNAGDQVKVNGSARLENSLMISNCGFFNGKTFTYNVDDCRSGGSALALNLRQGNTASLINSTLAGQGDCLVIVECDDTSCDGSENVIVQNNILQGYEEVNNPTDRTCDFWFDRDNFYQVQMDYNIVFDTKQGGYQSGPHDIPQDPLFMNADLGNFNGHLQSGSPAINSALPVGSLNGLVPSGDLSNASRPYGSGVDRGAYEYSVINMPTSKAMFSYNPVDSPVLVANPSQAKPLSIGSLSLGGSSLSIQIGLAESLGPVDIYGAYALSADSGHVFILNPDNITFQSLTTSEIENALTTGMPPAGAQPWRSNTTGPISQHLFDMKPLDIPSGVYSAYLLVSPTGSFAQYYLWATSFAVP